MRRLLAISSAVLCVGAVVFTPGVAAAAPTVICTVDDEKLPKITGITAVDRGYVVVAVNDAVPSLQLYQLDAACKPTRLLNDANIDPFAPQDLAQTPDKTIWIADVGDDQAERTRVAIQKVAPGAKKADIFRLTYPDGKHNAAAMVVQPNGVPVIITKEAGNVAKMYTTAAPLSAPGGTVPLKAAGTLTMPPSTTSGGPVGPGGRTVVTGAALSPDGKKVLVRTYTDAYEWEVAGDIPTTLKGKPRHTPLPDEKDGQAITFTADGVGYVSVSATNPSQLLEWTPAAPPEPKPGAKSGAKKGDDGGFSLSSISYEQLGGVVLAVGAIGLIMLLAGIVGIVRFRRRTAEEERETDRRPSGGPRPGRDGADLPGADDSPETVMLPRAGGAVYGSGAAAGAPAGAAPTALRGTVYGGGSGAGSGPEPADAGDARRPTTYGGGERTEVRPAEAPANSRGTVYGGTTYGSGVARDGAGQETRVSGGARPPGPPVAGAARPAGHAAPPGHAAPSSPAAPPAHAAPPARATPFGHGPLSGQAVPAGQVPAAGPPRHPGQPRAAGPPSGGAPGRTSAPAHQSGPAHQPARSGEARPAGTTYGGGAPTRPSATGASGAARPTSGQPTSGQPTSGQPTSGQPTSGRDRVDERDDSGRRDPSSRRRSEEEAGQWPAPPREPRDWRSRKPRD